ncbi:MAG: ABC transporter substrate-binding protein [Actinomycetia bacterium]|nr:ABC transporter substrate-binding protein [Actinomycetes bacterium]
MDRKLLGAIAVVAAVVFGLFLFNLVSDEADEGTATDTILGATTTEADGSTTTSSQASTTTGGSDAGFPVTIDAPNGEVTIDAKPQRIVSISPTSTEVLFAVGAGTQVVAVDDRSNFPTNAPVTDLTGFTPNVEAIASYDPDVVFLSFDPGDVIAGLEALDIPVILHPTAVTIADAYEQWEQVGAATGNLSDAKDVVATTQASIATSIETLPDGADILTYYYELDPTFYSATSSTFVGELFALTGMSNIADPADLDGYGFPQLTAEYIIEQNPGLIYLADTRCCGQSIDTVAERPGWNTLDAVVNGAVVELDDDIASRWGPRIAELVDDIVLSILDLELVNA